MRAALLALLFVPRALCAGTAEKEHTLWLNSGAPCTTQIDVAELGGGSRAKCLERARTDLRLRPILGHVLIPFKPAR